ncbi:MAG: hypothetical protein GY774_06685 [Planctomycetes bacterium]|nr:hypothetical protein [Planctomycetota bacterium]
MQPPPIRSTSGGTRPPLTLDAVFGMLQETRDEIMELRGENMTLKSSLNTAVQRIVFLEKELDDLNQYNRRENVVFSNLKVEDQLTAEEQVIGLCDAIGVEVKPEDMVDVHPLPSGKKGAGKAKRCIARFKDRKLAQKVMANRKNTKSLDKTTKDKLAANPDRGFAVQPNITPRRARLLGQVNNTKTKFGLEGCWVDPKNGKILLRKAKNERPFVISNTFDLCKVVAEFTATEYILCCPPEFEVFNSSILPPSLSEGCVGRS